MVEKQNFWGGPEKKPSKVTAENHNYTIWYVLAGFALIAVIAAIILNNNFKKSQIVDVENSIIVDNGDLKINWNRYNTINVELKETYTIARSGIYHFTGETSNGNIIVNAIGGEVKIILENVTISSSDGPAIACLAADDLVIELIGENALSDSEAYSKNYDEDVTGAIYSKADLTFEGEGTLNLTANYQDAIVSKDDLKFNSGKYNIIAKDDGIRGKDSVYIVNGDFEIKSKGDGIKSTNETDAGKGFVLIEDGNIAITTGDDGVHAINSLIVKGGAIDIKKSYEGLEAQNIIINGGDIIIVANDDGINAGGGSNSSTTNNGKVGMFDSDSNCILTVNNGNIYVNAAGDGIDSNGYVYFNGGTVVVDGPTNNGNGALDSGISIIQNGGTVIAVGAVGMAETLGTESSVNSVNITFDTTQKAGTKITIKNSSGEVIIEHISAKSFSHLSAGTAELKTGETYTIYIDDEAYQTFTISGTVTTIGNARNNQNMMPPGGMRR